MINVFCGTTNAVLSLPQWLARDKVLQAHVEPERICTKNDASLCGVSEVLSFELRGFYQGSPSQNETGVVEIPHLFVVEVHKHLHMGGGVPANVLETQRGKAKALTR